MIETKDSPEAEAAKAEGWAAKKAEWKPMTLAARAVGGFHSTKEFGEWYGKRVRQSLEAAGRSTEEIDRIVTTQMVPWLGFLEKSDNAISEVRDDPKIPRREKQMLIQDMYAQEDAERVRLFGE